MKFKVLDRFKAQTKQGEIDLIPGQLITLYRVNADPLIEAGKITPLKEVMFQQYKQFIKWLSSHDVTVIEIKTLDATLVEEIHMTVEAMDRFYDNEDYQGFLESMIKVKRDYLDAVRRVNQPR